MSYQNAFASDNTCIDYNMNGTILSGFQNKSSDGMKDREQILNNSSKEQIIEIHRLPETKMDNQSSINLKENMNELSTLTKRRIV